jgi:hypothetical protein
VATENKFGDDTASFFHLTVQLCNCCQVNMAFTCVCSSAYMNILLLATHVCVTLVFHFKLLMVYVHKCQTKEVLTAGRGTEVMCIFIMLGHELQFSALASVIMLTVVVDTSIFVEWHSVMHWSEKFLM